MQPSSIVPTREAPAGTPPMPSSSSPSFFFSSSSSANSSSPSSFFFLPSPSFSTFQENSSSALFPSSSFFSLPSSSPISPSSPSFYSVSSSSSFLAELNSSSSDPDVTGEPARYFYCLISFTFRLIPKQDTLFLLGFYLIKLLISLSLCLIQVDHSHHRRRPSHFRGCRRSDRLFLGEMGSPSSPPAVPRGPPKLCHGG